jgi:hypothetical protein
MADANSSVHGFLYGLDNASDSTKAFVHGKLTKTGNKWVWLAGSVSSSDSCNAYLYGGVAEVDAVSAYTLGTGGLTSQAYAYLEGVVRSTVHAFLEGKEIGDTGMVEYDHIWLKDSDLSVQKKFRVIAQGYDDGTLEKAENIKRTIGGGIDHSVGAVYRSWSPVIRVRQDEPLSDYGSLDDLVYFYSLNEPGGAPSNDITLVDHLGQSWTVHIIGDFRKSLMGVKVEGQDAWSLVRIRMIEV